jgi:hypothetical protein
LAGVGAPVFGFSVDSAAGLTASLAFVAASSGPSAAAEGIRAVAEGIRAAAGWRALSAADVFVAKAANTAAEKTITPNPRK